MSRGAVIEKTVELIAPTKIFSKIFKKPLDKPPNVWYNKVYQMKERKTQWNRKLTTAKTMY
jgi:hypothetical protein